MPRRMPECTMSERAPAVYRPFLNGRYEVSAGLFRFG